MQSMAELPSLFASAIARAVRLCTKSIPVSTLQLIRLALARPTLRQITMRGRKLCLSTTFFGGNGTHGRSTTHFRAVAPFEVKAVEKITREVAARPQWSRAKQTSFVADRLMGAINQSVSCRPRRSLKIILVSRKQQLSWCCAVSKISPEVKPNAGPRR